MMDRDPTREQRRHNCTPTVSPSAEARVDSRALFGMGNTLLIDHFGQRYTLRITRENKLILTK